MTAQSDDSGSRRRCRCGLDIFSPEATVAEVTRHATAKSATPPASLLYPKQVLRSRAADIL
ncbi:hypothetical protein I547_5050 [Mycobacterium kansasii 824]|uniref:Uncharacterized protein n=1 Tax=Mycobacterium kansasii TaxID=1768 RepID=A0A1V3WFM6_MYCKA|nr:hypothetical protein I547_5050 [Mycobacterium kansasii 824]OOK65061.1 hypothetical protein BZL30_8895 [Mycobacterium kansasii]